MRLRTNWRAGELLLLAGVLLAGLGLRLAILSAYEPSIDLGVRLNWARRIATAESFGPLAEMAQRLAAGEVGAVRALLASRQDSFLFAVLSNLYAYIPDVMRLGSALAMAAWNLAFGFDLATSRLLTILVDLAGVAVLAFCTALLTGSRRAGLAAAAVLAGLPAKVLLTVQSYYHVFGWTAALVALWSFAASPAFAARAPSGVRPWGGVARTGLAMGASMYFDWFQPQLVWVGALACTLWNGAQSRDLVAAIRRFAAMTAILLCVTAPILVFAAFHHFVLGTDVAGGYSDVADQLAAPSWLSGDGLAGYGRVLREYFSLPVLLAALLGLAAAWRRRGERGAASLLTVWAAIHFAAFALLTSVGSDHVRSFQHLETPVAIAAGWGIVQLARAAARGIGSPGLAEPAWLALAAVLLVASVSLARAPALAAGAEDLAERMPLYHAQYPRGHEIIDLCQQLGERVPEGSSLLANSWQLLEAVCPQAKRWSVVNLGGICARPDATAQREYLREYFPSHRWEQEHFVVLDRRYALPLAQQEQCLSTVMQLLGSQRAVPVLSGPASPSAFLERVVRLEHER
jgi:hypothetical protein